MTFLRPFFVFRYVNIDDGWACERDAATHELTPCPQFPNMTALGAHLHGLGLQFGLYVTNLAILSFLKPGFPRFPSPILLAL